jgi:hypothetical protein
MARSPTALRAAHEAAQQRFAAEPTQANWLALQAIVQAAIDRDDAQKRAAA